MNIWIDLANSPQVLFFKPIIDLLQKQGHCVFITSRDFAQTKELADSLGLEHTAMGIHGGKKWTSIIQKNLGRVSDLVAWAQQKSPIDLAVSHNSYSQALAAAWLRIPFVTLMDYEFQPLNHLCFRLAKQVIVPEPFPTHMINRFGASRKTKKYPGIKEQMYLADFIPRENALKNMDLPDDRLIIVIRPPAPWAAYHRFENTVFEKVLTTLSGIEGTQIVFLPRITAQGEWARQLSLPNIYIPPKALNGPDLLYAADLVISGGGTMNREAAVLGTPAYTVFKGKLGCVDQYLIDQGRLVQISEVKDIEKIRVEKRWGHETNMCDPNLVKRVTELILEVKAR